MLGVCLVCPAPVRVGGRGRPQVYCSEACRKRDRRSRELPREMTSRDRWVRWALVPRRGKSTKVPLTLAGRHASSTNATTWATYSDARASKVGDGLGFVLGDGTGCIDLDGCLDEKGRPSEFAQKVLAACPATFIEVSQSGRGLHIFGLLPEAPGRAREGVEVYSAGRFIAMTGRRWGSSPRLLADLSKVRSMLL